MKTNRTILFAAAALFAVTAVSCNKEENGNNGEETVYTLELADPLDKEIILNDDQAEAFDVELNTNIDADQLSVESKEEQDWCAASLATDGKSVKVTPGSNFTENDLTATFVISTTVEGVTPVEFTVIRRGTTTEYYVKIESEDFTPDEMYTTYETGGEAQDITVTVLTNAAQWYLSDMYWGEEADRWFSYDKVSGRNGETVTIHLNENKSSERNISFMFTYEEDGYMGPTLTIMQTAKGASSVTVSKDNQEITTDYPISISAGETVSTEHGTIMRVDYMEEFSYTSDGAIDFKYYEAGTDTDITEEWYETGWVWASPDMEDDSKFTISCQQGNSGAARSVDIVIVPAGGTDELFRFKVTQAGA